MNHLTIASVGRLPPFPTSAHRLRAVRTLVLTAGEVLALFCIVDEHLHALLQEQNAARRANQIRQALQAVSDVPLDTPHLTPVQSRSHLSNLVPYVLTQVKHHDLRGHPALWEGSCLPDLVGARQIEGFDPSLIEEALPRRLSLAWDAVGLRPCEPAADEALAHHGPAAIVGAAARAVGRETISGETPAARRARRAAAVLLHQLGYRTTRIAEALGIPERSARRLAAGPSTSIERCIRLQLAIRDQVVEQALDAFARRNPART